MPQNSAQSRITDDATIGRGLFVVRCGWVNEGALQAVVGRIYSLFSGRDSLAR